MAACRLEVAKLLHILFLPVLYKQSVRLKNVDNLLYICG